MSADNQVATTKNRGECFPRSLSELVKAVRHSN